LPFVNVWAILRSKPICLMSLQTGPGASLLERRGFSQEDDMAGPAKTKYTPHEHEILEVLKHLEQGTPGTFWFRGVQYTYTPPV
jgi:hypothetical protein